MQRDMYRQTCARARARARFGKCPCILLYGCQIVYGIYFADIASIDCACINWGDLDGYTVCSFVSRSWFLDMHSIC
jgi:hypothetical protein